jgi:hypothetical protein
MYHGLDPFLDAMRKEMQRHFAEKGESWRSETVTSTITGPFGDPIKKVITTQVYLEELLSQALDDLMVNPTQDQRVDVANICAMLWMWEEGLAPRV